MRDAYHEELDGLSDKLVEMTRLVRSAMARAATALLDADLRLAEEVITADEHINKIEADIEDTVFDLMARQQPVATDLRMLVSALRMSADLERMGDLAVHLAKTARRRHPESAIPPRNSKHRVSTLPLLCPSLGQGEGGSRPGPFGTRRQDVEGTDDPSRPCLAVDDDEERVRRRVQAVQELRHRGVRRHGGEPPRDVVADLVGG